MELHNALFIVGLASVVAGAPDNAASFPSKTDLSEVLKPKNIDMPGTNTLIRSVMKEAQFLLNPCNLFDTVRDDVRKAPVKTKLKGLLTGSGPTPVVDISRRVVFDKALPAIRDGIRLYRTMFVLQETTNLTVFLDQNRDNVYANTSLNDYSHYYVRASTNELTQILFIGLLKNDDLQRVGPETPAMEFLSTNGLIHHPRQYVDFETIPRQEAELILEKRQQMANLLRTQGTFWADDRDYLTSIMTVAFNGPEQDVELSQVMPKIVKNFVHKMQEPSVKPVGEDLYEAVCLREKQSDQALYETLAMFAL
ncbi:hypothetical protein BV898_10183 [Hypsibius exemplaris]|uniref:Uncharacterized protein n=1 Tax=Hypsibius exemplaris TaxID=2072580 RepID=A0A1W0WKH2_HYPEX|nr:hypothetical protein BV898_10183 [Hypsibius exemplaris]